MMRPLNQFFCLVLLLPAFFTGRSQAQSPNGDSLLSAAAYNTAIQRYHTFLAPETGLYRGSQYADYAYLLSKGQPFFGEGHIQQGTILYNGIYYGGLPLLYDQVMQQLITFDAGGVFKIALITGQIDSFTIGDHIFIHLRDSLNPTAPRNGFYEQLYKDRVMLLKKEKKTLQDDVSSPAEGLKKYVEYSVAYYLKKGNRYYPVNTRRSLLAALGGKEKDAKRFMRKNELSMHLDKENTLLKVTAWYNSPNQ